MKHTLKKLTLTIAFLAGSLSVSYSADYDCSVEEVALVFEGVEDREFVSKNLRKTFLVKVGNEKIFVTQISSEFKNAQKIFEILSKGPIVTNSVFQSLLGLESFTINKSNGDATYVFQMHNYAGVWRLKCK